METRGFDVTFFTGPGEDMPVSSESMRFNTAPPKGQTEVSWHQKGMERSVIQDWAVMV